MGVIIGEIVTEIVKPDVKPLPEAVAAPTPADADRQTRKVMQQLERAQWRARRLSAD